MPDKYFQMRYSFDKGRSKVWRAICQDLQRLISNDATVFDLGCGYGDFINNIQAKQKIAVDLMVLHGVGDWYFAFDNANKRFGRCNHNDRTITLSSKCSSTLLEKVTSTDSF